MIPRAWLADRRLHWIAGSAVSVCVLLLGVLAVFPWGSLKGLVEVRLSNQIGQPVTIGRIDRRSFFSLHPEVEIRDVRVPQAAWAGKGDLARLETARVKFAALPLLIGRFRPEGIVLSGLRLALVRDRDKRVNWRADDASGGGGFSGIGPQLTRLSIRDSVISYDDGKRDRRFVVKVTAHPAWGVRIAGSGTVRGTPVKVSFAGPAFGREGAAWPFRAAIDGPALGMAVRGTMDAPLDLRGMTIDLTARASDLRMIDAIIEAGLFGTQPVRLKAHARHDAPDWKITGLSGTVGRSDLTGQVDVRKRDGRTKLKGAVAFGTLSFDDLSSDEGLARGAALERQIGPRLVPATRINLRKIIHTDGTLDVSAGRLVGGRGPSALTWLKGTITLDHQLLLVAPLQLGLMTGAITGSARIDQRGGPPEPLVTIDLALKNSNVAALAGGDDISGDRVEGRVKLVGKGSTIREVVGRSTGRVGLVARDGSLPAKIAALIGFDVGKALTTGSDQRTALRCAVLRLDVKRGVGTVDPLVIDTGASQSTGRGTIAFPSERLAVQLTGAPKKDSVLRLPGSVTIGGTIRAPDIVVPREVKSVGNVLKAIGRKITGRQGPVAGNAACQSLEGEALSNGPW